MKDTQSLDQLLSQLDSPKKDHRNKEKQVCLLLITIPTTE